MGIKPIWTNSFYTNLNPIPRWSFEVNFGNLFNEIEKKAIFSDSNFNKAIDILNNAIINFHIGKRTVNKIQTYFAGMTNMLPGRVENTGDLELTFNENGQMHVSRILERIFEATSNSYRFLQNDGGKINNPYIIHPVKKTEVKNKKGTTTSTITEIDTDNIRKDRIIELKIKDVYNPNQKSEQLFDDTGVVKIYKFHGCFISDINAEELSYENTEDILTRTVNFTYAWMEVIDSVNDDLFDDNDTNKFSVDTAKLSPNNESTSATITN